MLKIMGAVCVLCSCTGIGFAKSREYRQRISELLLLKRLMLLLRGEIKYALTPLPEAFDAIGRKVEHQFGKCMEEIGKRLKGQSGVPLAKIWEEEFQKCMAASCLSKEDAQCCVRLGQQLGYLDKEMQVTHIDFYIEQLEGTIERLEEEQGRRSRVCRSLGVFAGVMICLVLL